jgi:ketosteroid isomerase-like protein
VKVASANLDLVRAIYAAWERGDYSSTEWAHPQIEYVITDGVSPRDNWTGLTGIAQVWGDFLGAWDGFRMEAEEYRELDRERVLVLVHFSGRGKASGLEIAQIRSGGANLLHVREGKVSRCVFYLDRARALADLGLGPEGGSP